MSNPYLLPEILEYIIDLLQNNSETLKRCCLVSKSWVPRTRKHLFVHIELRYPSTLEAWKKTFPDVTNSPAHHARFLMVGCPELVTAADGEEGGWIQAFSGVTCLNVNGRLEQGSGLRASEVTLAPFRKLSPTLKSLRLRRILLPHPGLFNFILSFPLLEDLCLTGFNDPQFNGDGPHEPPTVIPSTSPPLTGLLDLHFHEGAGDVALQLLDLPIGLRFRSLMLSWDNKTDLWWVTKLLTRCSHTLEFLEIFHRTSIIPASPPTP